MPYALLFEINAIQNYLFASGRLRDVIGASELLDRLTNREDPHNLLDAVGRAAGVDITEAKDAPRGDEVVFTRRAGGAFYAFSEQEAPLRRLRDLWSLAVQQTAPYLSFNLGIGSGDSLPEAFRNAREALRRDNDRLRPHLPLAPPLVERSRRTGRAGVEPGKQAKDGVMDAAIWARKPFAGLSESRFLERYAPEEAGLGWRDWPRDLEAEQGERRGAFPFVGESRILALIHADGNGLGVLLRRLAEAAQARPERFVPLYQGFSRMVDDVTRKAAQAATREVLVPARKREGSACLPARPIVLGGDDLMVLVRADLALDYLRVFTRAFETQSRAALSALAEKEEGLSDLPRRLTLGAGLVFIRASQPFHLAIRLAESLMATAKRAAKAVSEEDPPSSVAFYRVTSSLVEDYDQLVETTLGHEHGGERYRDTLGTYFLGDHVPRLDDLLALTRLLGGEGMARGPTRELLTLIGHAEGQARMRYRRWRQLMKEGRPEDLRRFDALLETLAGGEVHPELPYARPAKTKAWRSPLGDALALLGAGCGAPRNDEDDGEEAA